jgi:hypothetical protein
MATGQQFAADGLTYRGHVHYVSGGAPGDGPPGQANPCDCSSWVNKVAAVDFGLAIPGYGAGTYRGQEHGPVVVSWAGWSGAVTLPPGQRPSPGDLCCFVGIGPNGHIGIATGPHTMVSCLNPELGVQQTGIEGNGPAGAPIVFRRIKALGGASLKGGGGGGTSPAGSAAGTAGYALLGLAAPVAGVALVVGGAAVAGTALALVLGVIIFKGMRSQQ